MTTQEKLSSFKSDLKALLKKYDATIFCNIDGDTHGITTSMEVGFRKDTSSWKSDDFMLTNTSEIETYDL